MIKYSTIIRGALRGQNSFFRIRSMIQLSPCNQRFERAVSHPPEPFRPRIIAFNRTPVYRGTLTLHLVIAPVIAFLGFSGNSPGRPRDFRKSSREYLISSVLPLHYRKAYALRYNR